ncbi:MAG: hypothetical protein P4L80_02475 [Xanthobacteraceae bacterium]|nr:hypothetical protein [Xanthobacteraceae bacterium]
MKAKEIAARPRVPAIVRLLRRRVGIGRDVALRLTTDARMVGPWKEVRRQAKRLETIDRDGFQVRLAALPDCLKADTWLGGPCPSIDLTDQACVAFFLAAVIESAIPKKAVSEHAIAQEAQRWRAGAALCREATYSPHRGPIDCELREALRISSAYFNEWAAFVETASEGPYKIKRGTRKLGPLAGNDAARGYVRAVAEVLSDLFSSPLRGTIATTATIVLGCSISNKDVENQPKRLKASNKRFRY